MTLIDAGKLRPTCPDLVVRLLPRPGVTGGNVRVTGSFRGAGQCHEPVECPIDGVITLRQGDGDTVFVR